MAVPEEQVGDSSNSRESLSRPAISCLMILVIIAVMLVMVGVSGPAGLGVIITVGPIAVIGIIVAIVLSLLPDSAVKEQYRSEAAPSPEEIAQKWAQVKYDDDKEKE